MIDIQRGADRRSALVKAACADALRHAIHADVALNNLASKSLNGGLRSTTKQPILVDWLRFARGAKGSPAWQQHFLRIH